MYVLNVVGSIGLIATASVCNIIKPLTLILRSCLKFLPTTIGTDNILGECSHTYKDSKLFDMLPRILFMYCLCSMHGIYSKRIL